MMISIGIESQYHEGIDVMSNVPATLLNGGFNMEQLAVVLYEGHRVLTTRQLAERYETEPIKLQQNFANNKERYREGEHFFLVQHGDEAYSNFSNSLYATQPIYLWTEKGCFLHAKSLGTDRAWDVYVELLEYYFRTQMQMAVPQTPIEVLKLAIDQIAEQDRRQRELEARTNQVERTLTLVKDTLIHRDEDWRKWVNHQLNRVAFAAFPNQIDRCKQARSLSYDVFEERAHCRLEVRLDNLRNRLADRGWSKSRLADLNALDVIEDEPRLKEIYDSVVKELVIKYVA
jgi:hypothetical protein